LISEGYRLPPLGEAVPPLDEAVLSLAGVVAQLPIKNNTSAADTKTTVFFFILLSLLNLNLKDLSPTYY
jgi:hypothetical protein